MSVSAPDSHPTSLQLYQLLTKGRQQGSSPLPSTPSAASSAHLATRTAVMGPSAPSTIAASALTFQAAVPKLSVARCYPSVRSNVRLVAIAVTGQSARFTTVIFALTSQAAALKLSVTHSYQSVTRSVHSVAVAVRVRSAQSTTVTFALNSQAAVLKLRVVLCSCLSVS